MSTLKLTLLTLAAVAALVAVGCGGDDEESGTAGGTAGSTEAPTTTREETATATEPDTTTETAPTVTEGESGGAGTSPEDSPGGAGDETPARSLALLTGENGRIRPRVVRVPPFISIRVELRAADDGSYGLRFPGGQVQTGPQLSSQSVLLEGLRPGDSLVGRPVGDGNMVRIVASAEPGP